MSEVEKLYNLAGVERKEYGYCSWDCDCPYTDCEDIHCDGTCPYWEIERVDYPPFTAEKQLSLIKWLMNNPKDFFSWTIQQQGKDIKYAFYVGYEYGGSRFLEFTEALADILNDLWQDLTEAEKAQIKEILK